MEDDRIYEIKFEVTSDDANPPNGMFRVASGDLQVSYRLQYYYLAAPDSDGEIYPIYFETHDYVPGQSGFNLNFEIAAFEDVCGGSITLGYLHIQHHAVPW